MKKNYFITLEGPDGSGKSTQIKYLTEYLMQLGYDVICTREPGGSHSAERIRQLVLDPESSIDRRTETLLYLAARADHLNKIILPALQTGKIVVCDRFSDSTMVYQGLVRGLPLEELERLNDFATEGLKPDLTFILDGAPKLLAERRTARGVVDRFENEGLEFQEKVREGFLFLSGRYPERIKVINALQSETEVKEELQRELLGLLKL